MKLNVNAKELLALYNLLHDRFEGPNAFDMKVPEDGDEMHLRQIHNRLKAWLVAALSNKQVDPVDAFLSREQAKIDRLKDQNDDIKKETNSLAEAVKDDPDFFIPKDDEDYTAPEYPRRGSRNQGGKRGGGKR